MIPKSYAQLQTDIATAVFTLGGDLTGLRTAQRYVAVLGWIPLRYELYGAHYAITIQNSKGTLRRFTQDGAFKQTNKGKSNDKNG